MEFNFLFDICFSFQLFRKHSEMCTKYSDTFQKLKELKVEMAEKLYSNLSDIDLICGTTQNPLTLKSKY